MGKRKWLHHWLKYLVRAGAIVIFAPVARHGSLGCGVDTRIGIWIKNGRKPKKEQNYRLKFSITAFEVNINVKFWWFVDNYVKLEQDYLLEINLGSIIKYIYSLEIIYRFFFDIFFNMMILEKNYTKIWRRRESHLQQGLVVVFIGRDTA